MSKAEKAIKKMFRMKSGDNVPIVGRKDIPREKLIDVFKGLDFKIGAEIGVYKGEFSKVILDGVPGLKLICVDSWINHGKLSGGENKIIATKTLKEYDTEILDMDSRSASLMVEDESLDFVYIDAAHDFDNVMMDIICWTPKVKPGGIVSGHDYHPNFQYGVIEAVNAYTRCHNIYKWYVTREIKPTWIWVK